MNKFRVIPTLPMGFLNVSISGRKELCEAEIRTTNGWWRTSNFHIVNLAGGQVSGVLRGSGRSEEGTNRLQMWVKSSCGDFSPFLHERVLLYQKEEHQKQRSRLRAVIFKYFSHTSINKKIFLIILYLLIYTNLFIYKQFSMFLLLAKVWRHVYH